MSILKRIASALARVLRIHGRRPFEDAEQAVQEQPAEDAAGSPVRPFCPTSDPSTARRRRGVRMPGLSFRPGVGSCRTCPPPKRPGD